MKSSSRRETSVKTPRKNDTSWQPVQGWYHKSVGNDGHYYHQHVVLPNTLKLLALTPKSRLLDLGCGQGVLSRQIPPTVEYHGVDLARDLIATAKKLSNNTHHTFTHADVTKPLRIPQGQFTHATILLALQNMAEPEAAIANASRALQSQGKFLLVLNHPCFRIPRQSSWGVDEARKLQYRRIDRYMSELKVPITAHPGQSNSAITWSFHLPLSAYTAMLARHGFAITQIEEWVSDKGSVGTAAKMENRGRAEFPLFLAILAEKIR